ncbi:MAG TPA: hypothetical protein VF469_06140 [Kofleriaceae bacterium]
MRILDRLIDRLFVCLYLAIAALPVAAMVGRWGDHRLEGAVHAPPRPALSLSAVRSEDYQARLTAWFEVKHGLRNGSIWIDNTILYHAFHETKWASDVVIGNDDVLFQRDDIGYFNKQGAELPDARDFDLLANRIAALQLRLARDHRALVPMFVPSKTTIFPDEVPAQWTRDLGSPRPSTERVYLAMKRALDAHRVVYIDGIALLLGSPEPRDRLWGPSARHFSDYAGCLCTREVVRRYAELTGRPGFDYPCQVELRKPSGRPRDLDLFRLLNAWGAGYDPVERDVRHDPLPAEPPPGAPSVLWIASSFGWTTMDDAVGSRRFGALDLDYYHRSVHAAGTRESFDPAQRDARWRSVFLGRDIYVLELFETYLSPSYFGADAIDAIAAELGP